VREGRRTEVLKRKGKIDGHKEETKASERASDEGREGGRGGGLTYHFICLSIGTLVPKSQEENTIFFRSACPVEGAANFV